MKKYSKTAIITGISGQDGLISTELLISRGWNIVGVTRNLNSKRILELGTLQKSIKFIKSQQSFGFFSELIEEYNPKYFLHWGSPSSVSDPWRDPVSTFTDLALTAEFILQAIATTEKPRPALMLPISSEIFPKDGLGKNANSERDLKSIYAVGKSTMLDLANLYRKNFDIQVYCPILFPHESPLRIGDFFTRKIVDAIIEVKKNSGLKLRIGDLNAMRDWSWAPSVVQHILEEMEMGANASVTVGSGTLISTSTLIESFFTAASIPNWQAHFEVDPLQIRKEGSLGNFASFEKNDSFTPPSLFNWSKLFVDSSLSGRFLGYSTLK